jgi:hypothetical protein
MLKRITRKEFARELGKAVARVRRKYPPRFECTAPPIDLDRLRSLRPGKLYEGFEEDLKRMRRGLEPLGPRE